MCESVGDVFKREEECFLNTWIDIKPYFYKVKFDLADLFKFGEFAGRLVEMKNHFKCFSEIHLNEHECTQYNEWFGTGMSKNKYSRFEDKVVEKSITIII